MNANENSAVEDLLGDDVEITPAPKKTRKKTNPSKKPSKAVIIKVGGKPVVDKKKAAKANGKNAVTKKGAKAAAKGGDKPKPKKVADNLSMQQPEDDVVLKAVRKLKEPTLASKFSKGLEVHRRVIRAQLQRLAKDKGNQFTMKKIGPHWTIENRSK